jgi:hypothetical protein
VTHPAHRTLLLIKSNPEIDPRPAEAIRSALGLIAGEIPLSVYFFNESRSLLTATTDELEDFQDGEILKRFLPTLLQMAQKVFYEPVEKEGSLPKDGSPLTLQELGRMLPDFDHTIVF